MRRPWWAVAKGVIGAIFSLLGFCLLNIVWPLLLLILYFAGEGGAWMSVFAVLISWMSGVYYAKRIAVSDDRLLSMTTPLTARTYHGNNLRRVAPVFLPGVLISAAGCIALLVLPPPNLLTDGTTPALALNLALSVTLCLVLPLAEALSGMVWTRLFFFPRFLAGALFRRGFWVLTAVPFIVLLVTMVSAPDRLAQWEERLLDTGLLGQVVFTLAVPFGGVARFGAEGTSAAVMLAAQATFLAFCVTTIVRHWGREKPELAGPAFEDWTRLRDRVEDIETEALDQRRQRPRPALSNAAEDGFAEPAPELTEEEQAAFSAAVAGARSAHPPLAYEPFHTPERQMLRHWRYWAGLIGTPPPRRLWMSWVAILWVGYVLVRWAGWFEPGFAPNGPGNPFAVLGLLQVLTFLGVWAGCALGGSILLFGRTGPARWTRFLRRALEMAWRRWLIGDVLAAVLLADAMGGHLESTFLYLAMFVLLRAALLSGRVVYSSWRGGRRMVWRGYVFCAMIFLAMTWLAAPLMPVVGAIFRSEPGGPLALDPGDMGPLVAASQCLLMFLFALSGLALAAWAIRRNGDQVIR
ncbi:MAG: hypothetical protein RLY93_02075 [Sumerlaeia bacterium]